MQTHNVMLAANCLPGEYHACVYCMIFIFTMVHFSFLPFITAEKVTSDFSQVKAKIGSLQNTHHQPGICHLRYCACRVKERAWEGNFVQLLDAEMLHV